jgi:hypothetical protein
MKTIVSRAPRPAGAVVEQWMGMDESKTVYVPSLPNFVVSIAATPLPENSVISFGNRNRDFLQMAVARTGEPVLHGHESHAHHEGLSTLDDIAPALTVEPQNASWQPEQKAWTTTSDRVRMQVALTGPTAARFRHQPARLVVYVDQTRVLDRPASDRSFEIDLPRNGMEHVVAVNWASDYGPVAATALRARSVTQ